MVYLFFDVLALGDLVLQLIGDFGEVLVEVGVDVLVAGGLGLAE